MVRGSWFVVRGAWRVGCGQWLTKMSWYDGDVEECGWLQEMESHGICWLKWLVAVQAAMKSRPRLQALIGGRDTISGTKCELKGVDPGGNGVRGAPGLTW